MPHDIWEKVNIIPYPMKNESATQPEYLSFEELFGKETSERDLPSSQSDPSIPRPPFQLKVERVRDWILCVECSKPRLVYSVLKLTTSQYDRWRFLKEEYQYTCGSPVMAADIDVELNGVLYVKLSLKCRDNVEEQYYNPPTELLYILRKYR